MSDQKEITLEDLQKEAAATAAASEKNKISVRKQLIVFKLGGEEYALPIDQVKEVVLTPQIAKVPQTASYVIGAANIRGNVIAIIDLEDKFGLAGSENKKIGHYTLVIENEKYKVGVLVKEVPNTLTVNEDEIDESKDVLQFSSLDEDCVTGIVKFNGRMIILVDMIALLEKDDSSKIFKG